MRAGRNLFAELKRRHVWRVAAAYAIAAWLIVQIATQVFPFFNIPNWSVRLIVLLVVIGFPVVLALAWAFEMTPEGIRRTEPEDSPDARTALDTHHVGRRLNIVIIVVLMIAVAVLLANTLVWHQGMGVGRAAAPTGSTDLVPSAATTPAAMVDAFHPPADTLVVLPFKNLNGDPKQAYFSDGITEELTNALGENTALRVIAWDTASTFRDPKQTATDVGKKLNVANLLHGSILREGDQVRVTAELVNTVTGYQLWSAHYDQPFKNIFKVQDQVSEAIANAMQVKFAGTQAAPTTNPQAHEWYLKGLAALDANFEEAPRDFEQAIALDPDYADAYAGLARAYLRLVDTSTLPLHEALPKIRAAANKALQSDPSSATALADLASVDEMEGRIAEARQEFARAVALDPSSAEAHLAYANVLSIKAALQQVQTAATLDPRDPVAQANLALYYTDSGDYQRAVTAGLAFARLAPNFSGAAFFLAYAYQQLHRDQEMVAAFDRVSPIDSLDRKLWNAGKLTYRSLIDPDLRTQALTALEPLRNAKLSPDKQTELIQLYLALGEDSTALPLLTKMCTDDPLLCNDLAVNPIYTPLRGDARFQGLVKRYNTITRE